MSISACIIVRDAADVLMRCIDSIRDACDEICVVDTGSVDNTPHIGRNIADKFAHYTGCNDAEGRIIDFSDARNYCLAMASGDWILSIDADEVLHERGPDKLRRSLQGISSDALAIVVRRGQTEWQSIRLFKRSPQHIFIHEVHEVITTAGPVSVLKDVQIEDRGQNKKPEQSVQRNIRICTNILGKEPQNLRAMFYRAQAYRISGSFENAIYDYNHFLSRPDPTPQYRCAALEGLAICYLFKKEWQQAIIHAQVICSINSSLAESYCILGDAHLGM